MAYVDLRNRAPEVERLPDSRQRVTDIADVLAVSVKDPAKILSLVWLPWGTAHPKYTDCRLIKQFVAGQRPSERLMDPETSPEAHPCHLTRVYETIDASLETAVGNADVVWDQENIKTVTQTYIQLSTGTAVYQVPGVTAAPAPHTDSVLREEQRTDDGTLRTIKRVYVNGGLIAQSDDTKNNGALLIETLTYIRTVPTTPTGYTLIRTVKKGPLGLPIYDYVFAKGDGLVVDEIRTREDGLREQTYISLGTKQTPTGVVIRDETSQEDGYVRYTVTSMQSAAGGDPTGATLTLPRNVMFTYPGRAKSYNKTIFETWHAVDVFLSPPVEVPIAGQLAISYQTSNALGTIGTRWLPTEWATEEAAWYGLGGYPQFHIEALRGYRSVDDTPITITYGSLDTNGGTMLGQTAFGGSDGVLTCYGGPEDPVGNTYTFDATLEVAFTSTAGVVYYRKSVLTATIPSQPSLPV
jgi:hypothetical protein